MNYEIWIEKIGLAVIFAPLLMLAALGITSLVGLPLNERRIGQVMQLTILTGLIAALTVLGLMLWCDTRHVTVNLGNWVSIPQHYHFEIKFVFDRLSVPFVVLTFLLCGTIGKFATRYMHRERGFNRFFVFFSLFVMGMTVTSLADTIETLFFGWELVGLSSALLVAFFHERPAPVRNGLRVWSVYRVSDAALLIASIALHRMTGEGDFDRLLGMNSWPEGVAQLTQQQALTVGVLLLVAAAGKSALVPFSGWLPRAMEGPTPSSAVFYGALSVHLGAFLLLRVSPIYDLSPWLCAATVAMGAVTAVYASFTVQVQTDIKSALSFASLTQVGIIVAEIGLIPLIVLVLGAVGLGEWAERLAVAKMLRYLCLVHLLGHACLRTLQFLRAPTLLLDYHTLENAIGDHLPRTALPRRENAPAAASARWYRLALERGYLDALLGDFIVAPFLKLLARCERGERAWLKFLNGNSDADRAEKPAAKGVLEDYL